MLDSVRDLESATGGYRRERAYLIKLEVMAERVRRREVQAHRALDQIVVGLITAVEAHAVVQPLTDASACPARRVEEEAVVPDRQVAHPPFVRIKLHGKW